MLRIEIIGPVKSGKTTLALWIKSMLPHEVAVDDPDVAGDQTHTPHIQTALEGQAVVVTTHQLPRSLPHPASFAAALKGLEKAEHRVLELERQLAYYQREEQETEAE